ncbi:MAG: GTP-binding DUF697 domain-containing protein [Gemmataceae bacterium]|nr:GTP-binding DUF697 domain-containing protein [Gemmataceae bacterium]
MDTPPEVRAMFGKLWESVTGLFSPKVSEEQVQAQLAKLREQSPVPVFWLFGKTQTGKTSIVKLLTGAERAEIGQGFKPCTRTSSLYDFPNGQAPLLRFLDTRGLDEPGYDPAEDIARFHSQAHVVVVTVKLLDHAQENILRALRQVRKDRPDRPVVLVVTTLHEAYPQQQHPTPWPYTGDLPDSLPKELRESLHFHHQRFAGLVDRLVPVDLTPADEGFNEPEYGGEVLRNTLIDLLPQAQAQTLRGLELARAGLHDLYSRQAAPTIVAYSSMAASAGAVPLPVVDLVMIASVQTSMLNALAKLYGVPFDSAKLKELAAALGAGLVARSAGRSLIKLIPVVGSVLGSVSGAILAGAATFALGKAFLRYCSDVVEGKAPDMAKLKAYYEEQFVTAREGWDKLRGGAKA